MFGLIRRWKNWYTNRHRAIFEFWDGSAVRRVDPVVASRNLDADPDFDWDSHPAQLEMGGDSPEFATARDDACRITAAAVRRAFSIPEFSDGDGIGLTEGELVALLLAFVDWSNALKKNISTWQTSSAATEREPLPSPSPTNSSTDSIKTSSEPRPAEAVESSSPSMSP